MMIWHRTGVLVLKNLGTIFNENLNKQNQIFHSRNIDHYPQIHVSQETPAHILNYEI